MKRILIAVISEGDSCVAPFCLSLVNSVKAGLNQQIEFFPVFFSAESNWSMGFNCALTLAWKQKLDGFVCVSPRVGWSAEALLALVTSDKNAVALPVATRNGFEVKLGEIARLQEDGTSGEIKVLGSSLNFIYLSPYAIEKLCEAHASITYRGEETKLVLQSGDIFNGYHEPAEILAFRLLELGIELWLQPKYTANRLDYAEYKNDFQQVLNQLKTNG